MVQQQSAIKLRRWLLEAGNGGPISDITQSMLRAYYVRCGRNAVTGLPNVPPNASSGLPFARRLATIAAAGVHMECNPAILNEPATAPGAPIASSYIELDPVQQPRNLLRTLQLATLVTSVEQLTAPTTTTSPPGAPAHTRFILPLTELLKAVATSHSAGGRTPAPWAAGAPKALSRYLTSPAPPPTPPPDPPPATTRDDQREPRQQPPPDEQLAAAHQRPPPKRPANNLLIAPALAARLPPYTPIDPTQTTLDTLLQHHTSVIHHTGHTLHHPSAHVSHAECSPENTFYLPEGEVTTLWSNAAIYERYGACAPFCKTQAPRRRPSPALRNVRRARPTSDVEDDRLEDEHPVVLLAKRIGQDEGGNQITQYFLQFGGGDAPMALTRTSILHDLAYDGYELEGSPYQADPASGGSPHPLSWDTNHDNWPPNTQLDPDTALWHCTYKPLWENEVEANIDEHQAKAFDDSQTTVKVTMRQEAADHSLQRKETVDAARVMGVRSYHNISHTMHPQPAAIPNVHNRPECAHPDLDTLATGLRAVYLIPIEPARAEPTTALHAKDGRCLATIHTTIMASLYDRLHPAAPGEPSPTTLEEARPTPLPSPSRSTPPPPAPTMRECLLTPPPHSVIGYGTDAGLPVHVTYNAPDDCYNFFPTTPHVVAQSTHTLPAPTYTLPTSRLSDLWRRHAAAALHSTPPPPTTSPPPVVPDHHSVSFRSDIIALLLRYRESTPTGFGPQRDMEPTPSNSQITTPRRRQ